MEHAKAVGPARPGLSSAEVRILVATDVATDAELVRKLLAVEFERVHVSTVADSAAADFERVKPKVLVLAFNGLEKAERYYLGLYRLSTLVHATPHRTVILCNKDDLRRVYELCRREYFDDYILFWPMSHDAPRLPMAVFHALRQLAGTHGPQAATAELAAQARRIAELEAQLALVASSGERHVADAARSLHAASADIGAALDGFSRRLADGELREAIDRCDAGGIEREVIRLKREQIEPSLRAASDAVAPVRDWLGAFRQELAPQLESARALGSWADQLKPLLLVVDDDEFQQRVLGQVLAPLGLETVFARSGTEALGLLRKRRPDLVLMDIGLPDIDGVEVTRRIKAVEALAGIPIVMITGHSEKQLVVDSLKAGACDFLVKPLQREATLAKVRKVLRLAAD
jgi:CheY-like chemotaxis protein